MITTTANTVHTITDAALLRLLQLASATLPVGGYAFSAGLETAQQRGWLADAHAARDWLALQLRVSLPWVDLPLLQRQLRAARTADGERCAYWNDYLLACRESAELRLAETAMGEALARLLRQLEVPAALPKPATFITAFAAAAAHWQVDTRAACLGYTWSWLESQVAAATKLVPLGQGSAQRLLGELAALVPAALDCAEGVGDDDIGSSLPGLALAGAWHETQYSRLFRS